MLTGQGVIPTRRMRARARTHIHMFIPRWRKAVEVDGSLWEKSGGIKTSLFIMCNLDDLGINIQIYTV